ncbi:MAG TPA: hypothetical protein VLW45_04535 [Pelomicrobium sp.]|nr:hypothetical protein [Pelomicrobium sp.]
MKYRIDSRDGGLTVSVHGVEGRQGRVLAAFRQCQDGTCGCPTNEYAKLERVTVTPVGGGVELHLEPKAGAALDAAEVARCVDYTLALAGGGGETDADGDGDGGAE